MNDVPLLIDLGSDHLSPLVILMSTVPLVPLMTEHKKDLSKLNLPSHTPFGYLSLESGMSDINRSLTGSSGVYLLINNLDPSRYYIGSSVNLGRRLSEY